MIGESLRFAGIFPLFFYKDRSRQRYCLGGTFKDRYAISDKNILRSCVVRYFYLKFLACRSPMPWEMYKKKGKKMGWAVRGGGFSPDETFASTLSERQQFVRKNPLSTFLLYSA